MIKISPNITVSEKELDLLKSLFFAGPASKITESNKKDVHRLSDLGLVDLRDFYGGGFGLTQKGVEVVRPYYLEEYEKNILKLAEHKRKVSKMFELTEVQKESTKSSDDYMRGMYNGMLVLRSIFTNEDPLFIESEKKEPSGFVLCATDSMGKFYNFIKGNEECDCCVGYRMMIVGIVATSIPLLLCLM